MNPPDQQKASKTNKQGKNPDMKIKNSSCRGQTLSCISKNSSCRGQTLSCISKKSSCRFQSRSCRSKKSSCRFQTRSCRSKNSSCRGQTLACRGQTLANTYQSWLNKIRAVKLKICARQSKFFQFQTKLAVIIPLAIYTLPGNNPDRGVIPDILTVYSIEDYKNHKDKELDKVRELIKKEQSSPLKK